MSPTFLSIVRETHSLSPIYSFSLSLKKIFHFFSIFCFVFWVTVKCIQVQKIFGANNFFDVCKECVMCVCVCLRIKMFFLLHWRLTQVCTIRKHCFETSYLTGYRISKTSSQKWVLIVEIVFLGCAMTWKCFKKLTIAWVKPSLTRNVIKSTSKPKLNIEWCILFDNIEEAKLKQCLKISSVIAKCFSVCLIVISDIPFTTFFSILPLITAG